MTTAIYESIEYVEVTFDSVLEPVTTNLTKSQDETQCVPFWSCRTTDTINDFCWNRTYHVEMIDNAGTPAVRITNPDFDMAQANDIIFGIFIVEFTSAITVQQISAGLATGATSNDIDSGEGLSDTTDQSSTFMVYSYYADSSIALEDNFSTYCVGAHFDGAATDSIILERVQSGPVIDGTLYVVTCSSGEFTVEHADLSLATNVETNTVTISSTVLADTMLIASYKTGEFGDDPKDAMMMFDLTDTTTVTGKRNIAGNSGGENTCWVQVIECQDSEWDVQRGEVTMDATVETPTMTTVTESRSIARMVSQDGMMRCGRNSSSSSAQVATTAPLMELETTSGELTLTLRSIATIADGVVSWEVIQFADTTVAGTGPAAGTLGLMGVGI